MQNYQTKRNTDKNMIARDVAFVSTDVDRQHDGYTVVIDVGLYNRAFQLREDIGQD